MELVESYKQSFEVVPDDDVSTVYKQILMCLQLHGPMPVQALVDELPQFRWVYVLRAVSSLWGNGKVELEHYKGQLKVWLLDHDHTEFLGENLGEMARVS